MTEEMLRSTVGWPAGVRVVPEAVVLEKKEFRIEHDSIGDKKVPVDAYYGVQTLRAVENFRITGLSMHPEIINSLVRIKKAAAITTCSSPLIPWALPQRPSLTTASAELQPTRRDAGNWWKKVWEP